MICINVQNGRKLTEQQSDEIIKMAIGQADVNGNPFEMIGVVYKATKGRAEHKVGGFEDAMINYNPDKQELEMSYREGHMTFRTNRLFGGLTAKVPKTPFNMKKLAACFYEKMGDQYKYQIKDITQRLEIQKLADKTREERTPEQIEIDKKIASDSNQSYMSDGSVGREAFQAAAKDEAKKTLEETNCELLKQLDAAMAEQEKAKKKITELESVKKEVNKVMPETPSRAVQGMSVTDKAKASEEYHALLKKLDPTGSRFGAKRPTLGELHKLNEELNNEHQGNAGLSGAEVQRDAASSVAVH